MTVPRDFSDTPGSFTPRGLIVSGLFLHVLAAILFWQFAVGLVWTLVMWYPVAGGAFILLVATLAIGLSIFAWRRNSWPIAIGYFIFCVVSLPWMFAVLLIWPRPS